MTPVYDPEAVLGGRVIDFVQRHVNSLLAWDIIVFYHRNPDAVLDMAGLASRLGRRVDEIDSEIRHLCESRILQSAGGLIRYKPSPTLLDQISDFVDSCQDRAKRLALIALVLHRIGETAAD